MQTQPILAAEFYPANRAITSRNYRPAELIINRIANGERELIETIQVLDKREARAVAKGLGATPWNF